MNNAQFNEIIMALIGQIDGEKSVNANHETVLMRFIYHRMEAPALALIATRNFGMASQSLSGTTHLIYACMYNMEKVAMALIANGHGTHCHWQ